MTEKVVQLNLNTEQLATVLLVEGAISHLQVCANQLGGFLKLQAEANILIKAMQQMNQDLQKLKNDWARSVVVVPGAALSAIDGGKKR